MDITSVVVGLNVISVVVAVGVISVVASMNKSSVVATENCSSVVASVKGSSVVGAEGVSVEDAKLVVGAVENKMTTQFSKVTLYNTTIFN